MPALPEIDATRIVGSEQFLSHVAEPCRPVVLRGMVRDWPVVRSAATGDGLAAYLSRFDTGGEVELFVGERAAGGRYYYTDDLSGFNFERRRMALMEAVAALLAPDTERTLYLGSMPIDAYLPGLAAENPLPQIGNRPGRLWLGHVSRVAAHYDALDNVACVIAGARTFTLYPPQLVRDLYVGPIDHTMAGQPVSLAASAPPGDPRFPRFAAVADQALVASLLPGDAIYIPKLWWHQVESTAPVNGLVNFWWDAFASGPDAPFTAMLLAMISIAERPAGERAGWAALFDHYVFRPHGHPLDHLPPDRHGILGPLRPTNYGRIRARVMQMLRGG